MRASRRLSHAAACLDAVQHDGELGSAARVRPSSAAAASGSAAAASTGSSGGSSVGTLYYLPLRGRAECLRMMLAYAGLYVTTWRPARS